jgi:single-stranded-DNA-specific exonuclease
LAEETTVGVVVPAVLVCPGFCYNGSLCSGRKTEGNCLNHFTWTGPKAIDEQDQEFAKQIDQPVTIAHLLRQRGVATPAAVNEFLHPELSNLHDPFVLHDMQKACDRIKAAVTAGEKITIYGDYDADGITSTAIMKEAIENLGGEVEFYIPNRFTDGYGPNMAVYKYLVETGTKLIVTVDNGITGHDEIAYAQDHGTDVIVTDHHELPTVLPEAYATVHARYPDTAYPFGQLSGAGVAFKVASALMEDVPADLLDLAAIGTLADVMPLVDENRIIAYYGLQQLQTTDRLGLQSLYQVAKIDPSTINEETVGFVIAPRLNALGRVDDGTVGVTLLTTFDPDEADTLAQQVEDTNTKRRSWVQDVVDQALVQARNSANQQRRTLVIAGEGWHEGILGIVANRIAEDTGKPTIVLSREKLTDDYKGSGRTAGAYNLFDAMDPHREDYIKFGGHAAAVGLTIAAEQMAKLAAVLEQAAQDQQFKPGAKPTKAADLAVTVPQLTLDFYGQLAVLAPFGTDNTQPILAVQPELVRGVQTMGQTNAHLRCQMVTGQSVVNTVGFNLAKSGAGLMNAQDVTMYGTLQKNTWQGRTTPQFQLMDINVVTPVLNDLRSPSLQRSQFSLDAAYVFFQKAYAKRLATYLNDQPRIMFDDPQLKQYTKLVLVDAPTSIQQLQELGQNAVPEQVWVIFYASQSLLSTAMPDKRMFGSVFNEFKAHTPVNPDQLPQIAKRLQLDMATLRFIIQVFFDLGFLAMDGQAITFQNDLTPQPLDQAPHYQARLKHIQLVQTLQTGSWDKVRSILNQQFH